MPTKKIFFFFLAPVLLSFILHFHVFNLDVLGYHVWRQSQTQTVIYNFTFSDNSILHPQRFDLSTGTSTLLYEFPLYQWLIAQINNVIGYSVLHSRIFTFSVFVFFLLGFFRLLKKFVSVEIALYTNSLICFSPLLYYYSVNPLPDTMALCIAIWSLYFFFSFLESKSKMHFLSFACLLSIASLVKLPYILFGGVFMIHFYKELKSKNFKQIAIQTLVLCLTLVPFFVWYAHAIPTWTENGITQGITKNKNTILELLDYFQFGVISSVPELLTNYASVAFLITGIVLFIKHKKYQLDHLHYFVFVFILFSIYFMFELNMIEKVHDYYLMPFIPLIFLLVASGSNYFYKNNFRKFMMLVIIVSPLTAWLRIDQRWNLVYPGFCKDYMTYQTEMQNLIPSNGICIIDSDESKFIVLYYLKRQGYSLLNGELNTTNLQKYYSEGARYLVSENANSLESDFPNFVLEPIFSRELKIYKLQKK